MINCDAHVLWVVYLQVGFWNHSSVAFTVLSQPPSICCHPDNPQYIPPLKAAQEVILHYISPVLTLINILLTSLSREIVSHSCPVSPYLHECMAF